jgi:hypothetical protein
MAAGAGRNHSGAVHGGNIVTRIYDEHCAWPYVEPYGMVAAPKVKKPRKSRKVQVSKSWKKLQLSPRKPFSQLTPRGGVKRTQPAPQITPEMEAGLGWKRNKP